VRLPEPAVEELGPDEPVVAVEGRWIDLLEFVREPAEFGQGFVLAVIRVAEDLGFADVQAVVVQGSQPQVDGGVGEPCLALRKDVVDRACRELDAERPFQAGHEVTMAVPGEALERPAVRRLKYWSRFHLERYVLDRLINDGDPDTGQ
jgi:hypothetical protein